MVLKTPLGNFVIDPYRTPVRAKDLGNSIGWCLVGNVNGQIYRLRRRVPEVFGGRVIEVDFYYVTYCPLWSQWPVTYQIRRDWNEPFQPA